MSIFLNAAYQILTEAKSPLSSDEITQQSIERGLLFTQGKTPSATMASSLYMDIKNNGSRSRFIQVGPNLFTINYEILPNYEPYTKSKRRGNNISSKLQSEISHSAHNLLDREIAFMKAFLRGQSPQPPTSEKLCDWINICYTFGLYSDVVDLFGFVDPLEVNDWYYTRTKKMAKSCALHQKNHYEGDVS